MPTRDYKESLFEDLQDPEFAVAYLNAALEESSSDVFLLHLRDVAEARGAREARRRNAPRTGSALPYVKWEGQPAVVKS